ncbi:MAG: DUF6515 family protein, partial [Gemmatimonadota bacterium]
MMKRVGVSGATGSLVAAATLLLAAPGPVHGQSGARARPAGSPATIGVVAPRPVAPAGHEPRVRAGRSSTGARTSLGARPNVDHAPNVGGHGPLLPYLPGPFTRVRVGGKLFYYCLGSFYTRHSDGYALAESPVGAVVRTLPAGHETIELGNRTLFYHDGVFYERGRRAGEYVVVAAPAGAVVGELPRHAAEVRIGDQTYYLARGIYYLPVRRDGELA